MFTNGKLFSNKTEVLIDAIIWINLENIMLSKRSQEQKNTYDSMYMTCPE